MKSKNPVILSIIHVHHRQNPLEMKLYFRTISFLRVYVANGQTHAAGLNGNSIP
jgi:hypothetical protein